MARTGATVRGLAAACHPEPTLGVSVLATALAAAVGLGPARTALVGVAVLAGQLSIGWSNDRLDAARDRISERADKPAAAGRVPLRLLTAAAAVALGAAIVLSALLGGAAGAAALVLVAAGWAYNLGLKGTWWSGAAYLAGFAALPAVPYLARDGGHGAGPPWWVPLTGALLGLGAHVANVLPDLRDDEATGVRGLPHRLGERRAVLLMAAALAGAAVSLGLGSASRSVAAASAIATVGLVLAAGVVGLARRRTAAAFRVTIALALVDVVLLVVLVR